MSEQITGPATPFELVQAMEDLHAIAEAIYSVGRAIEDGSDLTENLARAACLLTGSLIDKLQGLLAQAPTEGGAA